LSNLCIGTCLLEPNVATPLHVIVTTTYVVICEQIFHNSQSSHDDDLKGSVVE